VESSVSSGQPAVEWGIASRAMPGQTESGDGYLLESLPHGVLAVVIDGLGHGAKAAAAARVAVDTLKGNLDSPILGLFRLCHRALRGTRGVVMSVALLEMETATWLGVGNVGCVLLRAGAGACREREVMRVKPGVVGYQLPRLQAGNVPVAGGDTLVFATDGVHGEFLAGLAPGDPVLRLNGVQRFADSALERYGKKTDDALVLAVRYVG
jgi:negative regulator of sigma-B (phosphoserine phosphatase)